MAYDHNRAIDLLRIGTGDPHATFRNGQEEAIRSVVEGRDRLLVVQRAGWGKSFVYFIATKLLREQGQGPALLISPLLALMRNQITAAQRMGVNAETINSDNKDLWEEVENRVHNDMVDILLISPERLANQQFVDSVLTSVASNVSMLVVDEAHCVSDWGHDFRPDYRRIERIQRNLPQNTRLLATTATVNDRVMDDLQEVLGTSVRVIRGDLGLPSVRLQTIRMPDRAERMAWLADTIPTLDGSGIVYALTVRDAVRIAEWLQSRGIKAVAYYSGQENRAEFEEMLLDNQVKCLVATTALGMGFDKPDLGFVIHYQTPGSVVAYYQQVGRAGRAIDSAYGVLLSGDEEHEINEHFITSAFPTPEEAGEILQVLETSPEGLTIREIEGKANVSQGRIEKSTKILALESPAPIVKDGSKWKRTATGIEPKFWDRVGRLTERRREEVEQMKTYVNLESGLMPFLIEAMDGNPDGAIADIDLPQLPTQARRQTVIDALTFLRGKPIEISPRKRWPPGGYTNKSSIDADHRAEEGRALCVYGDSGWGNLVREGKYSKNHFEDELVNAVVEMFNEWSPEPHPGWVTCIPSARDHALVADFAERVAQRLGLPFSQVLTKKGNFPEQKDMNNSAHKVRNVARSIELAVPVDPAPLLLIDDIVDSGWTFTVAAWQLLNAGSGPVWPLAIARKGGR